MLFLCVLMLAQAEPADEAFRREITALKQIVAMQDRRIAQLESALKFRAQIEQPPTIALASNEPAWKRPDSWVKVRSGMSRAQVVAILGVPTSARGGTDYSTLFFQGEVRGSGQVTGTVQLADDRVYLVNTPVF